MASIEALLPLAEPQGLLDSRAGLRVPERSDATGGFGMVLGQVMADANNQIHAAQQAAEDFAIGRRDDIHGTMLALSKANIELRLVGSIRNKIVDAFYELWRMQV